MTARPKLRLVVVALCVALGLASPVAAGPPTDALRSHMDRVFALLEDPAYKDPAQAVARHRALRVLTSNAVDFRQAAQQSLGAYWEPRTPDQQAYFVRLFTDLIDHAYLTRLSLDGERVTYDTEEANGRTAVVRGRALSKSGTATPVAFHLRQGDDDQWRIFDVTFEGMSLVANYRAQFNKIIRTSSYEELVTRLEEKTRTDAQASVSTEPASRTTR
jgi:phospholipid transport system substrate-binding protein